MAGKAKLNFLFRGGPKQEWGEGFVVRRCLDVNVRFLLRSSAHVYYLDLYM